MWLLRLRLRNHTTLQRLWGRGAASQGAVRPDGVGVLPPPFDEHLGLERRVERFPFQQLVPEQRRERERLAARVQELLVTLGVDPQRPGAAAALPAAG